MNEKYMGWFLFKRVLPDLLFLAGSVWLYLSLRHPSALCFMAGTLLSIRHHLVAWDVWGSVRRWFGYPDGW